MGVGLSADRPNILLLFSDDHALKSISAYGGPFAEFAPTPSIDRLAKEGAIFEIHFAPTPSVAPRGLASRPASTATRTASFARA